MRSYLWCVPLALAFGCGGSAQNPVTPQPTTTPVTEPDKPAEPHPEVLQALQRIEARMERVEDQEETIRELQQRIDTLEQQVEQALTQQKPRPRARPNRPNRPDPSTVYAASIDGAPYEGPKYAKVTIVKAFEFA